GIFNLTREHRQSVQKVLTPEQRQQMKAKMEAERAKMQQMQNNRFEKMASDLKLTEDQKARLITSREKNRKAMMSLRDQKNMDRTTLEKQRRSIMEQHRAELEQILSKDQLEQWKQANRDGFQRRHPARARGMQKQRIV
ncbi:MAG TPA: hypothetical protein VK907_05840, partial [Phnomibacter sp.]|nr:hypothetical protein [Phnomibacter sp.]